METGQFAEGENGRLGEGVVTGGGMLERAGIFRSWYRVGGIGQFRLGLANCDLNQVADRRLRLGKQHLCVRVAFLMLVFG